MVKASSGEDLQTQLEGLPEHLVGEVVAGGLVVSPRPGPRHAVTSSSVHGGLFGAFGRGGRGTWWILYEPELHLGPDILVPDVAGWRRARMPFMPSEAHFSEPPDWVCEVLSPRTAGLDRAHKMPIYARSGVPHLWLVDPLIQTLEVYLRQEMRWLLHAVYEGEATVHAPPFEEITLDLSLWWAPEEDPEPAPGNPDLTP